MRTKRNVAGRRLAIAFGIALCLHMIIACFIGPMQRAAEPRVHAEPVVRVHIIRARRPAPTPAPIPTPRPAMQKKPRIVMHARSRARNGARSRNIGHVHHAAHGVKAVAVHRELSVPTERPALPTAAPHAGSATVNGAGRVAGIGASTGAGTGGSGGRGEAGDGSGTAGTGAGDGIAPCGTPYIRRRGPIKTYGGLEHVQITVQLQLKDGSRSAEVPLPYPMTYHSDAESPFSERNRNNDAFPVLLQTPPPTLDPSTFSPVVQLILAHTTPDGYTRFEPCPQGAGDDGPP